MERLPLFISIGAFLAWVFVALGFDKKLSSAARGIGLGLSLVQLGSAVWATYRIFSETGGVHWSGVWFSLGSGTVFELNFNVDPITVVMWMGLSLFASIEAYFAFLSQIKGAPSQLRGESVALPILGTGALCALSSGNFISYYFGWALIAVAAFMAVSFSEPNREDRSSASFRYFILSVIPEVLFVAGMLGCYASYGTMSFGELNSKVATLNPAWAIYLLVAGTMLRNLQIPFMQNVRYLASAKEASNPIFFMGHAIVSSILFAKIYPAIAATDGIQYFIAVPAITAIAAAVLALPEQDPSMIVGLLVSYVCASVFMSGLSGAFQAAHALALNGALGAFLLAATITNFSEEKRGTRWFLGAATLVMTGLPITGWGWARYLEYVGFVHNDSLQSWFRWIVFGTKILADILMAIALWGLVRERWLDRQGRDGGLRFEVLSPLAILCLSCLAISTGGRLLGGMVGSTDLSAMPNLSWFERLIVPPAGMTRSVTSSYDLIGSDTDITARVLVGAAFLIPALLSGLWFFRDKKSLEEFREGCRNIVAKLGVAPGTNQNSILWVWILKPLHNWVGRGAAFFDSRVVDVIVADIWARPARFIRNVFMFIERAIIDKRLVDGLAESISVIGRSLRLVQNGQVQFYFAVGLILMGAVVIKFVVVGG